MTNGKGLADAKNKSRRGLLLGLAGLSAVAWSWQKFRRSEQSLSFVPISGLPGWQRAETGAVSRGSATDAVFLGLGDDTIVPLPPEKLCETLYPRPGAGLPVAVFTDINCPNCRSLETKLAARRDRLSITYLELPLLGPLSEAAARVSIAAHLLSGMPSEPPHSLRGAGISAVIDFHAKRTGLDPAILGDKMDLPAVDAFLALHASTAEALGVWGTPAMTIGKTLIMGDVSSATLDALLETDHPICG